MGSLIRNYEKRCFGALLLVGLCFSAHAAALADSAESSGSAASSANCGSRKASSKNISPFTLGNRQILPARWNSFGGKSSYRNGRGYRTFNDLIIRPDVTAPDLIVDEIVVAGNQSIPLAEIRQVMALQAGDKYDLALVMRDLKAIQAMGYFDDQLPHANPEINGRRVKLTLSVTENPIVTKFQFEGNLFVSAQELAMLFYRQLGKPQNVYELSSAIDRLELLYKQQGLLFAQVIDVKDLADGTVQIFIDERRTPSESKRMRLNHWSPVRNSVSKLWPLAHKSVWTFRDGPRLSSD